MPFFNRKNNDDLILAIDIVFFCHDSVIQVHLMPLAAPSVQAAGVTRRRNGLHKDKGGEKLAESEDLLEHRTDGTDAFDTLLISYEKFPQENTNNGFSISSVT